MRAGGSLLAPTVRGLFALYFSWKWIAWRKVPSDGRGLGTSAANLQIGNGPILGMVEVEGCGLAWDNQMFAWKSWQTVIPFAFGLVVVLLLAIDKATSTSSGDQSACSRRRAVRLGCWAPLFLASSSSSYGVAPGSGMKFSLSVMAVWLQQAWMTAEYSDVALGIVVFFQALGSVVDIALGLAIFSNEYQQPLPDASNAVYFLTKIRELGLAAEVRDCQLLARPVKKLTRMQTSARNDLILSRLTDKTPTIDPLSIFHRPVTPDGLCQSLLRIQSTEISVGTD